MKPAKQRLQQVSTNDEVVEFILERLSEDELNYLLVNFNKIMTKLKKTNTKLDKELFIQFIRKEALENPVDLGDNDETESIIANKRPLTLPEGDLTFFDAPDSPETLRRDVSAAREEFEDLRTITEEAMRNVEARMRRQQQEDALLANSNDSAPIFAGTNQGILNQEINPSTPQNTTISPLNTPLSSEDLRRQQMEQFRPISSPMQPSRLRRSTRVRNQQRQTGTGLISGRGLKMRDSTIQNRHYIGNFYIEKNKLKDNLLSIKYSKNEAPHTQLRPRSISAALRGLIEDVIANNYNEKVYHMLEDDDKRTFKKIVKVLKLPIDTYDDLDKKYQKNYELLKGQFLSGNNSPEVKAALRKYIVEGMNEGKLNRSESMFLLYQLSL
mgnify:FL=1